MICKETEPAHFCISIIAYFFPEMFNPNIKKKVYSGARGVWEQQKENIFSCKHRLMQVDKRHFCQFSVLQQGCKLREQPQSK